MEPEARSVSLIDYRKCVNLAISARRVSSDLGCICSAVRADCAQFKRSLALVWLQTGLEPKYKLTVANGGETWWDS